MASHGWIGWRHIFSALGYALQGLRAAFRNEVAFRQELLASLVILPLALYLGETPIERALLIGAWLQVMVVELLNSAVETTVDRIGAEYHALSGVAKDLGSAAVLLSIVAAAVIWLLLLLG